jgi:hypothetical protein
MSKSSVIRVDWQAWAVSSAKSRESCGRRGFMPDDDEIDHAPPRPPLPGMEAWMRDPKNRKAEE